MGCTPLTWLGFAGEVLGLLLIAADVEWGHAEVLGRTPVAVSIGRTIRDLPTSVPKRVHHFIYGDALPPRVHTISGVGGIASAEGMGSVSITGEVGPARDLPSRVEALEREVQVIRDLMHQTELALREEARRGDAAIREDVERLDSLMATNAREAAEALRRATGRTLWLTIAGLYLFIPGALASALGSVKAHC
jgi:hypothetical protein